MLRAGGVCVAGPGDGGALSKVSPRIRALQDRLMDSLPSEGAWECLSPAQREAILSLHRCRTTSTDDSSEHGDAAPRKNNRPHSAYPRFGRSRSYDDRLESETDDSGVRGSSGATSHNSLEDDSSDPGLRRGNGRFTKAVSAERGGRRQPEAGGAARIRRPEVTNGIGNVNKMISKQISKNPATSNITLDCRNVQGEKRRRSKVDADAFKESGGGGVGGRGLEAIREAPSRRSAPPDTYDPNPKVVQGGKEVASSEDYDSGVNLRHDDSLDEFVRQVSGCDLTDATPTPTSHTLRHDCSSDRLETGEDNITPRKPSVERDPFGGWGRSQTRERTKGGRSGVEQPPLKSNLKVGYGARLNSTFDYRTSLNQEVNRYTSNWNNFILSHNVPIRPAPSAAPPRESRFAKHGGGGGGMARSTGNLAARSAALTKKDPVSWAAHDPRRTPNPSQDRNTAKKYIRSKSLDRRYLDEDSSDEESDFETRRRTDRVRRYQKGSNPNEREVGRGGGRGGEERGGPVKAKSAWDLFAPTPTPTSRDDFDEFEQVGFRNRSDFRNKWESEDGQGGRRRKTSNDSEFSRDKWSRRSCDLEVEFSNHQEHELGGGEGKMEFDRKRWYRRSCDLDLDFELHHGGHQGSEGQQHQWNPQSPRLQQHPDMHPNTMHHQEHDEGVSGGRRTRLEDYYRSKTSLDHRHDNTNNKRERSRTPHLLRGKLRLLRAFLSF
ncbi:hypothetical protein Pcinc_042015 [Petrolisthes cinctipes]|uniref:Uncharacterized protein n=1 Tax=Petrolisthes cinctipes TaxID=88211 RepID=A0AAE1BIF1_PETCI|nr:hypothetical protein Pcinc_042015 [Petrolisthes cinctipes]